MRVLFVLDSYVKFYSIDETVRVLIERKHTVTVVMGTRQKDNFSDEAAKKLQVDMPTVAFDVLLSRRFGWSFVKNLRELINYVSILNNEQKRSWDVSKWSRFFSPALWKILDTKLSRYILRKPIIQGLLRNLEKMIPVDRRIKKWISAQNPDIVIVSPLVNSHAVENDYLQAALALEIPTVYAMYSWDNITSKGTFHSKPDYSIVWSESLGVDLSNWHSISPQKILITGAPRFDSWFRHELVMDRQKFYKLIGMNPEDEYILYVNSTFLLSEDYKIHRSEAVVIADVVDALKKDGKTKELRVLVRPHPASRSDVIKSILDLDDPQVLIYPPWGEFPDTDEKRSILYNSIYYSVAVVGVNTTAFLEAAILDKPCITLRTPKFEQTQLLPHFHHLTDAGFLDTITNAKELPELLFHIMNGHDERLVNRRNFVKQFIRPQGIDKPAAQVVADVIEDIALNKTIIGISLENYGI